MTREEVSNTGDNRPAEVKVKGGPFRKGDPRINRKGRPKSFDALRELAQQIAHETARGKDDQPILVNERPVTVTEFILRKWAGSNNPKLQQGFMEIAFGKVPLPLEHAGKDGGPLEIVTEIVRVAELGGETSDDGRDSAQP